MMLAYNLTPRSVIISSFLLRQLLYTRYSGVSSVETGNTRNISNNSPSEHNSGISNKRFYLERLPIEEPVSICLLITTQHKKTHALSYSQLHFNPTNHKAYKFSMNLPVHRLYLRAIRCMKQHPALNDKFPGGVDNVNPPGDSGNNWREPGTFTKRKVIGTFLVSVSSGVPGSLPLFLLSLLPHSENLDCPQLNEILLCIVLFVGFIILGEYYGYKKQWISR